MRSIKKRETMKIIIDKTIVY